MDPWALSTLDLLALLALNPVVWNVKTLMIVEVAMCAGVKGKDNQAFVIVTSVHLGNKQIVFALILTPLPAAKNVQDTEVIVWPAEARAAQMST